jgi:hypothetical protein
MSWQKLIKMLSAEIAKPLVRAIRIYRRMARHELDRSVRRELARHIKHLTDQGVHDPDRLTVCGLSYLRTMDRRKQHGTGQFEPRAVDKISDS